MRPASCWPSIRITRCVDELFRLSTKTRGRDKYALSCTESDEASDEALHIGPAHCTAWAVSLGLYIHAIKAKPILTNDAIDSPVSGAAKLGGGATAGPALAQRKQQLHDYAFKEAGTISQDTLKQIGP
jgi:hypothetical protein